MISGQVDLDACASEPIRIPGAIQPYGALIVLDPETLNVRNASANVEEIVGLELKAGRALAGFKQADELQSEVRRWLDSADLLYSRVVNVGGRPLQVNGHRTSQGVILEFEAPPASQEDSLEGLYPRLRRFLDEISKSTDIPSIARAAVREIRALTRFNRVLLYSFDEKGDGTVLAEDNDGVLPYYEGQRFPASDIPAQARELYKLNRLRLIADADYAPCPIEPPFGAIDNAPLDLSQAALRSVSPVHLEYMRNMGTGSSMSISILVNGELWGLISGHSREPKQVNAQVRTACDIAGKVLSLHIETRLQALRSAERLTLKQVETSLLAKLAGSLSFQTGLVANAQSWMDLTRAQGAAVLTQRNVFSAGAAPEAADIVALAEWLHESRKDFFVTDSLVAEWPEGRRILAVASGVIAVSISQIHPDYLFWFRPEVIRTIDWSGDPSKPMEPSSQRLHPRKSFELWREQVRDHSLAWSDEEIESALQFRISIQNVVLRRAEERAELTERLQRANKELESFSYSISHDLRAPFRHIVGFAELLVQRELNLDATSQHYLQTIIDAAISAGRLVDDLLRFSHLGRTELVKSDVDMRKLVEEVRRSLAPDTNGRTIEWRIGALPQAWGDVSTVRQAVQNLLHNAVKYSAGRPVAEIGIRGEETATHVEYTISDNGVGFEMAYVGKLFGVFQRLHRAEEFEGTGIGLALVKRIAERHGGSVSAWGEPGRGATFTLSLPKRPPA